MKIAYLDCFSGISGDMFLAALIDCGLPRKVLRQKLALLPIGPFTLKVTTAQRMHINGCRVQVLTTKKEHQHRNLTEIKKIITRSQLNEKVKKLSISVFERLARAEAKIHRTAVSDVHFHEVGALDSIIDIVGTAIGVDYLELDKFYASPIPLGSGFITSEHGTLPLPAPATAALLKDVPVYGTSITTEMVTPTGAALLTSLTSSFGPMPPMEISKIGYGAGSKVLQDRPNMLRILVGKYNTRKESEQVVVLETHIDDMNPELYDYLMECLFKQGALDVSYSTIQMKKNRPGVLFRVISPPAKKDLLAATIFQESTTGGIRCYQADRITLARSRREINTPFGRIWIKVFKGKDGICFAAPEYEQCKKIAKKKGVPLKRVYLEITKLLPPASTKIKQ